MIAIFKKRKKERQLTILNFYFFVVVTVVNSLIKLINCAYLFVFQHDAYLCTSYPVDEEEAYVGE